MEYLKFFQNSSTCQSLYRPLRILKTVSNKVLYRVYLNLFLMIFSSLLESLTVLSVSSFINQIQVPGSNNNEINFFDINFLNNYMSGLNPTMTFILLIILSTILRIFTLWFSCKSSAVIGNEVTINAYSRILNWPYKKHLRVNSSDNTAALTQFSKSIVGTINNFLLIIHSFFIATSISLTLLKVDFKLSLSLIFIISGAYISNIFLTSNWVNKTSSIVRKETLNTFKIIKESLDGIKDIILNDTFNKEIRTLVSRDFRLKNAVVNNKFISVYPRYLFEAVILICLVSFLVREKNSIGSAQIISQISIFAFGAQKLLPSMQNIYASLSAMKHMASKADNLLEIIQKRKGKLNLNVEQLSTEKTKKKEKIFDNKLELESIYYRHNNSDNYILKDFNLTLKRGEFLALMGPSGKGKTTLIDIIMGLIIPEKGIIKVDNQYILKNQSLNNIINWRYSISHVPQNVFLLDSTIKENIIYDTKNYREKDIQKRLDDVAEIVCLDKLINSLPKGYSEIVGERGSRFSGGQVQRIGLARAIFNKNPLIILDEATSGLDAELEEKILNNIKRSCKGSSLIMITHREESASLCDRVIYI